MESRRLHGVQVEPVDLQHFPRRLAAWVCTQQPGSVFWACDETPSSCRRGTHNNSSSTSRAETLTAGAAAAAVEGTIVVRIAAPAPDLGQLRRLPRQAIHPWTIKKVHFSVGCSACSFVFFVSLFSRHVASFSQVATFFYMPS